MMQQAQMMKDALERAQRELDEREVTGSAGGGAVTVVLSGVYRAVRVEIDESFVGGDREMLEDLIAGAFNDAVRQVANLHREHMQKMAMGMGLPPGLGTPFG